MYLSKIEIIGFKSFAQRVNLTFDAGVTAIVGPNGCGKTNIVDAIRWALGEQRYSTLRSDKMEDVIFNGTKNRKPLGLAEVSLVIENTKGILPTEYSQVTITRRVFRSGESEYLLNKVSCRLKDILDLFMDTGMGSDAYSVIELKMVETILSDKTDERRRLFEEAAGVTKYKLRRKAAYRKLESVQQDLARVNDIVKEVHKTVTSLERQAKKAEQYNDLSRRLRGLEIDLLERDYAHQHGKLGPLREQLGRAASTKRTVDDDLQAKEAQLDQLRTGMQEIESQLTEIRRTATSKLELTHRVEEKILIANERRNALTLNVERYENEKADLHTQSGILTQEKSSLEGRIDSQREELTQRTAERLLAWEEQERSARLVETKKTDVRRLKESLLALAHDLVQKRGTQERLKTRMDNLKGRIDRALEDNELYEAEISDRTSMVAQLSAEDRDLRLKFAAAELANFERERARRQLKDEADALQSSILGIRNDIERKQAKIDFLRKLCETYEEYSDGVRYLLGHETWRSKGLVTVADIVETGAGDRPAVEAALGETAHYLVFDRMADAAAAAEELRREDRGKAAFLCLEWVPNVTWHAKTPAEGTSAADLVRCDQRYRSLIRYLLEDVVVVDRIGDAGHILATHAAIRCVTRDGQILTSSGMMRSGRHRHDEGGLIGKQSQVAELETEIAALESELSTVSERQGRYLRDHEAMDLNASTAEVKGIEKEMTAIEMRIAQLEFEKKRAREAVERNRIEIENLEKEIRNLRQQYETAGAELVTAEAGKSEIEEQANAAVRQFEMLEAALFERTRVHAELDRRVVTLEGELVTLERDRERTIARMQDVELTLRRREDEIDRALDEIALLTEEAETQNRELGAVRSEYETVERRRSEIERLYTERRNILHEIELKLKDERRLHDDAMSTVHSLEMKIAELNSAIEHLRFRAKEEFDLELTLKPYPEDEWVDFAQRREEVKSLKDRIHILGAINFAAFDEFTTEGERLTFLTQQRDDLLEAEQTLLSTIEEINTTAQRKFLETFGKIRENFITTFKELFQPGDECDLKIEEGVDPLEANIEITAKPRGKRPTSIDLLSGGEKTLTAIALLFAIYLVKPSPFCILDEVDAPLDDSNIDRYTRILKKFSDKTQFIVVTHNKRTMEAAMALYGVTMEEEGVSKIVTVRFEEARVRSAAVTSGV